MHIHQYALLLRVNIIIPVLLIKNSVIMHIRKYALVRICINTLLRICVNVSHTVQGHHPDRICILVHRAQPICIIFMNTHYNGVFLQALWKLTLDTELGRWKLSLRKIFPCSTLIPMKVFSNDLADVQSVYEVQCNLFLMLSRLYFSTDWPFRTFNWMT